VSGANFFGTNGRAPSKLVFFRLAMSASLRRNFVDVNSAIEFLPPPRSVGNFDAAIVSRPRLSV